MAAERGPVCARASARFRGAVGHPRREAAGGRSAIALVRRDWGCGRRSAFCLERRLQVIVVVWALAGCGQEL